MGYKWRILRHPKTTQERRESGRRGFINEDDYRVKVRSKRNMKNLRNAWDDICRRDWNEKGWKKLRKTQYK